MAKLLENVAGNIYFKSQIKKRNEGNYLLKWKISHHKTGINIRIFRVFRPFSA